MAERYAYERTSQEIGLMVLALEEKLKAEYGCDFSYSVAGRGHLIAAGNLEMGHILPRMKCERTACDRDADVRCKHKDLNRYYCQACAVRINRMNEGRCFDLESLKRG
jgi:Zn finger protein HypA/HybF involved in hydrogenase expression